MGGILGIVLVPDVVCVLELFLAGVFEAVVAIAPQAEPEPGEVQFLSGCCRTPLGPVLWSVLLAPRNLLPA
eukprot:11200631-Lingulodinium_polyedra.AAC.1